MRDRIAATRIQLPIYLSRTRMYTSMDRVFTRLARALAIIFDYSRLSHNAVPSAKECARVRCAPHLATALRAYEPCGLSATRRARSMLRCLACSEPSLGSHCASGARHGLSPPISPLPLGDFVLVVRASATDWHARLGIRRLMRTVPSP